MYLLSREAVALSRRGPEGVRAVSRAVRVRERDDTSGRLLESSARHSFDPNVEVDWDAPLRERAPAMPLHRVSLYGTELWDQLDDEQRIRLSWHEMASLLSVGLWFEILLMHMLTRYIYDMDPRRSHAQYALTEIGDETRHSVMFAKAVTKLGCPDYRPGRALHRLGRLYGHIGYGPSMFASVLVAEESTDRLQRELMRDESVQPLTRATSRIHVVEEARHVRYAREELARLVPSLTKPQLEWHRFSAAVVSFMVVDSMINPRVYKAVGIRPRTGRETALANPHHQQTRRWMCEKITAYLTDVGMIGGPSTAIWRRGHLID